MLFSEGTFSKNKYNYKGFTKLDVHKALFCSFRTSKTKLSEGSDAAVPSNATSLICVCNESPNFMLNFWYSLGVGGWAFEGIDPRQYSSNFAMKCKEAVDQMSICEPKKIMEYAYNNTQNIMGSTFVSHIYHNSFSFLSFATSTKKEKSFEFVFSGQL
jgi:hypothetical protein